jgi:hypothetical protein
MLLVLENTIGVMGFSRVAEQLAAFQEGLIPLELQSFNYLCYYPVHVFGDPIVNRAPSIVCVCCLASFSV